MSTVFVALLSALLLALAVFAWALASLGTPGIVIGLVVAGVLALVAFLVATW